jgi:hypothetical protein
MRAVNALLLSLVVVFLAVIAFELQRIDRALEPASSAHSVYDVIGGSTHETFEQKVQRNLRDDAAMDAELNAQREARKREDRQSRK